MCECASMYTFVWVLEEATREHQVPWRQSYSQLRAECCRCWELNSHVLPEDGGGQYRKGLQLQPLIQQHTISIDYPIIEPIYFDDYKNQNLIVIILEIQNISKSMWHIRCLISRSQSMSFLSSWTSSIPIAHAWRCTVTPVVPAYVLGQIFKYKLPHE